jgi:hypothetical protein
LCREMFNMLSCCGSRASCATRDLQVFVSQLFIVILLWGECAPMSVRRSRVRVVVCVHICE